jgi:hypothetical protein
MLFYVNNVQMKVQKNYKKLPLELIQEVNVKFGIVVI